MGSENSLTVIDKKIKAEEYFGPGGYEYLGNGEFQGVQGFAGHQGELADVLRRCRAIADGTQEE